MYLPRSLPSKKMACLAFPGREWGKAHLKLPPQRPWRDIRITALESKVKFCPFIVPAVDPFNPPLAGHKGLALAHVSQAENLESGLDIALSTPIL